MSAESDGDRIANPDEIAETLQRWYHIPAIAAVVAFMLWARTQAYDRFVTDDAVYFGGNDPYYHFRTTNYVVENWPRRLYGDPWTQFPYGSNIGQYGTLMDQVVGTVALIVGLGDPSSRQVAIVAVLAPAVIASLIAIPVYFLAKRLSGSRIGGVTAAVVLALIPQGSWIQRGTVGFYDHHVAESLMMAIAVFGMVYALMVVRRERPVFEQVQDRDWNGLKPTVKASALAGVALAAYLLTWPSGVVLVGIFGVFFVLVMSFSVAADRSPEHLAFTGTIALGVSLLAILPWVRTLGAETTTLSFLQVLAILSVAAGCAFMGVLARYWEREELEAWGYPAVVGVLGLVTVGVLWVALPELTRSVWSNMERILFLGQSDTTLTISEAQSMTSDSRPPLGEQFWNGYGFTAFTALAGLLWMTARAFLAERPRDEYLLIAVWTVFVLLMTLTQVRFHYYLVLPVAVLNGWLVVQVFRLAAFPSLDDFENVQTYHVLTVLAVIMLLVVPIAGPLAVATSTETAEATGPGSVVYWQDNLDWMEENTPEPGTYGGADNEMSYYGPFDEVDGDYEYPEGAYGVMSWWDYGHWITTEAERIPNANPFQQGPRAASAYLQETNESRANQYLDALPADGVSGSQLDNMNEAELQAAIDSRTEQQANEETRYVMIDDQMVGGKFSAITQWSGPGYGVYTSDRQHRLGNQSVTLPALNQRYDETMLSRMYYNDGSSTGQANADALSHYRLVRESPTRSTILSVGVYTESGPRSAGLVGIDIGSLRQRYPGIFNSVTQQGGNYFGYNGRQMAAVKTFERVEGATLTGEAEPNQTVRAGVQLETNTGRTFPYVQDTVVGEDGEFEITVPYATTNELGADDGYTNSSVIANGSYSVLSVEQGQLQASATADNVSVPEPAIYDGEEIEVELEPVETNESDGANETDPSGLDGTGDGANDGTDGGGNATGASDDTASGSSGATASSGASATGAAPATWPAASATDGAAQSPQSVTGADVATQLSTLGTQYAEVLHSAVEPLAAERIVG